MARCGSCEKMVSLEMGDPEPETPEVDEDGAVSLSVRIVRNCADCSDELKEATFDMEYTPDGEVVAIVEKHKGEGHALECEEPECEPIEEGGGRYGMDEI